METNVRRRPALLWAFACTILLAGCGHHLPDSVGPNGEILVLADSTDWKTLKAPLQDVFEKTILTPQKEKIYWLRLGNVIHRERQQYLHRKNVLIIAPLDEHNPTSRFLRSLLSPNVRKAVEAGKPTVSWKENVWAKEQVVLFVTGKDLPSVVDNLRLEGDRLYRALEKGRNQRVRELIYEYGEQKDLTAELARKYGWSVRVSFGYSIMVSKPDSGFVALAKGNPGRWLFVYWEDGVPPSRLTPDWCIAKRNEITRRFFNGDRIVPGSVNVYQSEFAGKLAVTLQGLWENDTLWSGGPFKSYAFVDSDINRFFFVDVGVFSPNRKKEPYLRQVDLMARSFAISDSLSGP